MACSRKIAFIALVTILAATFMTAPAYVAGGSVRSTGVIELILNTQQTLIVGEEYEYTLELINLDACDKELSTDFSCIPTIAVNVRQLDVNTKEIIASRTLEHLNFGVHDLNILYDDVTIVSLNVLNIAVIDNKARIEVAYKTEAVETNILDISTRDNINANKAQTYTVELNISNNSDETIITNLRIDETASAQNVVIDNRKFMRNDEYKLTIQPGEMNIPISFTPQVEGHHWLSITIEDVQKSIPVLVHSNMNSTTNVLYVNKSSLEDILEDDRIIYDIKLDSAYLFGSSFLLLVFGWILGFIVSGRNASS